MTKDEFMRKVLVTSCGCWLWLGSYRGADYGQVNETDDPSRLAHRLAYKLWIGPLADEDVARHKCDVTCCANPQHVLPGTHKDNTADTIDRGRFKLPPRHKETTAAREALKELAKSPEWRAENGRKIKEAKARKKSEDQSNLRQFAFGFPHSTT